MLRKAYPRPQFVRENWVNLNGTWEFSFDDENQGLTNKWYENGRGFDKKIEVPFVYQTELSGINKKDIHEIVWYRKELLISPLKEGQKLILHFGAVDYLATVYVNGEMVGNHEGGQTSFSFDITNFLRDKNELVVRVYDPHQDETILRGKQYWEAKPESIWYTASTGIWQTVWLEVVEATHIKEVYFDSDIDKGTVRFRADFSGQPIGTKLYCTVRFQNEIIIEDCYTLSELNIERTWQIYQHHIFRSSTHNVGWNWSPESPNLFDVDLVLSAGNDVLDHVTTYFGMRKIHTESGMVYLNNRPYYQKLVLDQGYWPTSLLTAPDDEAFKKDILLSKEMGFNGCRKHQKVEDPQFLYLADKLGFLVWGESASAAVFSEEGVVHLHREWAEIVKRDYNHPSIITWVPLNESWGIQNVGRIRQEQHLSQSIFHFVHAMDTTRLVISNDGWELTETDVCTIHNYSHGQKNEEKKYETFKEDLSTTGYLINSRPALRSIYANGFSYQGEPVLLSEFGGIAFDSMKHSDGDWGYTVVNSEEEFLEDYERIISAVYESKQLVGFCYTQLTDVEQEINGLLTYGREIKCSLAKIKEINDRFHFQTIRKDS